MEFSNRSRLILASLTGLDHESMVGENTDEGEGVTERHSLWFFLWMS
jgi:hypothetical protein